MNKVVSQKVSPFLPDDNRIKRTPQKKYRLFQGKKKWFTPGDFQETLIFNGKNHGFGFRCSQENITKPILVGGLNPSEKYESQLG